MSREKLKRDIIDVLKRYPDGLKAREIAAKISNADKSTVNGILYSNTDIFLANNYVWKLLFREPPVQTKIPPKPSPTYSKPSITPSRPRVTYSKPNITPSRPSPDSQLLAEAHRNEEMIRQLIRNPELSLN